MKMPSIPNTKSTFYNRVLWGWIAVSKCGQGAPLATLLLRSTRSWPGASPGIGRGSTKNFLVIFEELSAMLQDFSPFEQCCLQPEHERLLRIYIWNFHVTCYLHVRFATCLWPCEPLVQVENFTPFWARPGIIWHFDIGRCSSKCSSVKGPEKLK